MQTFIFYTDPGHGWLEVPRSLLDELGIADKISAFSYQRLDGVFLEEDCDYSVFAQAMSEAGREFRAVNVNERYADSFVRSLQSYRCEVTK